MAQGSRVNKNSRSKFSLEKYYVDLVTSAGHYFIGYSARLSLGGVKIDYQATLHDPSMLGVNSGPLLSSRDRPIADESVLTWRSPRLGFDGEWRPFASTERMVLHQAGDGFVEWNCQQPSGRVRLTTASGATFHGLGYVEFLNLTVPPWKLGLRNLFWGRFVSETHSVVWIEWQGVHALTVLIWNGQRMPGPRISENAVKCDDFELTLEREATIRLGSIGETFVSRIPSILRTAPIEFLGAREEKYLSRGQLSIAGGANDEGWVIHERVSWAQ